MKNKNKPSAGMTGIKAGGKDVNIVGYGCGDDTAPTALKETRRLMQQLRADVMVGPLSGDEAVAIANWAKANPTKTVIIGTAGSQDPTMQIAPKNMFRYHGDGAQWNAGVGEIAYKRLGWRNAAIIMDDYSFGWTSAAGMIADFCAVGGKITKRVFPPLNNADYAAFVRQLPAPDDVDGYFWAVGGNTPGSLTAFEQAYGKPDPSQFIGNLFFGFLGNDKVVAPKFVGSYIGGIGTAPGVNKPQMVQYRAIMKKNYPKLPADDLFVSNYFQAGKALVIGLNESRGAVGARAAGEVATRHEGSVPGGKQRQHASWTREGRRSRISTSCSSSGTLTARSAPKVGRLRPERRPVVRRSLQALEPAPRARSAGLQEAEDAVAGEAQGREERRHHEQRRSGRRLTEAALSLEHAEPALRLRGVGRRFGGLVAVSNVDLEVADGERRAILGPNGAGKTTLFNVIAGDIPPSTGSVELYGADVTHASARHCARAGLARTYQQSRMLLGVTVEDSIYLSVLGTAGGRLRPVGLPRDRRHA